MKNAYALLVNVNNGRVYYTLGSRYYDAVSPKLCCFHLQKLLMEYIHRTDDALCTFWFHIFLRLWNKARIVHTSLLQCSLINFLAIQWVFQLLQLYSTKWEGYNELRVTTDWERNGHELLECATPTPGGTGKLC